MANGYDIACDQGIQPILGDREIQSVGDLVLEQEKISRPCLVSVSYVTDEHIRELNAHWRNQDRSTDVISLECERPNDPDLADDEVCELGDIVLAPDYIGHQADSVGWSIKDECRLLLIHGLLHLLGYDHIQDDEAERMEAREDELLALVAPEENHACVRLTRHRGEQA